jgi:hypothetical protein
MNKHYQYISQSLAIAITAIATTASPAWAQSTQPRRGDADQLRPAQGQPISPTNADEFSPNQKLPNTNLKTQNINLEVGTVEPVIPGNNNASPQKVNKSGNFSSDPLNAIQIFQESGTSRR